MPKHLLIKTILARVFMLTLSLAQTENLTVLVNSRFLAHRQSLASSESDCIEVNHPNADDRTHSQVGAKLKHKPTRRTVKGRGLHHTQPHCSLLTHTRIQALFSKEST